MLLSKLTVDQKFLHDGVEYVRDITGRDGGGSVAVRNAKTVEQSRLKASTEVTLVIRYTPDKQKNLNELGKIAPYIKLPSKKDI